LRPDVVGYYRETLLARVSDETGVDETAKIEIFDK